MFDLKGKRIYIVGHKGLLGSALIRRLESEDCEILTTTHEETDLTNSAHVWRYLAWNTPDLIINAAGRVGGIQANIADPTAFLIDNAKIAMNLAAKAKEFRIPKVIFIGAPCMYPKHLQRDAREEDLYQGLLEPTNDAFAAAKFTTLSLAKAYRDQFGCNFLFAIPTNLYGPGDNLNNERNHVVPALIQKMLRAKANGGAVELWGTGRAMRQFMYVDDAADGIIHLAKHYEASDPINIAPSHASTISISGLAALIAKSIDFDGTITFDKSKPDGMMYKALDWQKMADLGWRAKIDLALGIHNTCEDIKARMECQKP